INSENTGPAPSSHTETQKTDLSHRSSCPMWSPPHDPHSSRRHHRRPAHDGEGGAHPDDTNARWHGKTVGSSGNCRLGRPSETGLSWSPDRSWTTSPRSPDPVGAMGWAQCTGLSKLKGP